MGTQVKICGLKRPEDVEAVCEAGADYAGFVFYEKSKRYIRFDTAADLIKRLDRGTRSVALCVSPDKEILQRIGDLGFDRIQIHGEITPGLLDHVDVPVWQAVNLTNRDQLRDLISDPAIDGYVMDAAQFGSGKTFGWESGENDAVPTAGEIRQAADGRLFVLAGGLTPGNVQEAIRLFSPDVVDVSSGVENEQGKDRDLIFAFVKKVRET